MHFAMAFVFLAAAFMVGVPGGTAFDQGEHLKNWEIGSIAEDSPAEGAGLRAGDRVLAVDGVGVGTFDEAVEQIHRFDPGESAAITVERDGAQFERTVTFEQHPDYEEGVAFLGVVKGFATIDRAPIAAVGQAGKEMAVGFRESVRALARFFSPDGLGNYADNVREGDESQPTAAPAAPRGGGNAPEPEDSDNNRLLSLYGAVRLGAQITEAGWVGFLLFFAQINLFIGLFNLIPLLPFDGGHMAVATYERIRSRGGRRYYVDMTKLVPITYAVVFGMILLGITSFYLDLVDPVG
jgi:membrane-associated protease RseP (regulator of RpoE activity)